MTRTPIDRRFVRMAVLAVSILSVGVAAAQDAGTAIATPTASEIVARHVAAIGGHEAVQRHESQTMTGTLSMPAAGIEGTLSVVAARPDKFLLRIEIPGIGAIRQGFDGETAWTVDPMTGPMILEGRARLQLAEQSRWDAALYPAERYEVQETLGEVDFGGSRAWKVRMVTVTGMETFEYFDVESGLLVGNEITAETPLGPIRVVARLSDYREFAGVRLPTRVEQDLGPQGKQIMTIDNVVVGTVDPSTFVLPDEVRAMVGPSEPSAVAGD
jgi:hypothetical protein